MSQSVQYYTTRDGTTVAVAQKSAAPSSSSSSSSATEPVTLTGTPITTAAGATGFQLTADTLQLMGMAAALPNSNLFVNYPHTMWERDAEGNRIPVQVTVAPQPSPGPSVKGEPGDALSQATAVIKNEVPGPAPPPKPPINSNKSHICEICNKAFAKREHLTKHTRIHKDSKRYTCDFCQKQFRDRYELVRHQRRHTGDFPFRCNDCSKGFMRHERYMTHLRWHSGERPFQCNMCDKSFRDRSELNRHSRRHTGDLPYKCATCSKGFLRRERYVTHVRIHTGEKPFVCGVCSRGYRDKRELRKHQATHNHGEPASPGAPTPSAAPVPVASAPPTHSQVTLVQSPPARQPQPIIVASPKPPPPATPPPAPQPISQPNMATITFSLPTEPVPKNQLGIAQPEPMQIQPLNPAHITLPPSVASALQQMNTKTSKPHMVAMAAPPVQTIVKQEAPAGQAVQLVSAGGGHMIKQGQLVMCEDGQQLMIAGGGLPPGLVGGAGGAQPMFYYFMPGAVPQYVTSDGGATVRVAGGDAGGGAQIVTLPAGAIQAGGGAIQIPTSQANFPPVGQWILEASGQSGGGSGSSSARVSTI